jgi:LmbE family N-acetylglucosaminyl deacetylase
MMMFFEGKKILILSPHTDDGEIGAGGFISKFSKCNEVFHASFSFAKDSIPSSFPENSTEMEFSLAANILSIPKKNRINFDYKVRRFLSKRQEILDDIIYLKKFINPDLVLTPSSSDTHQDHEVIYKEGFRAFKNSTVLGYEMMANNRGFLPGVFVELSDEAFSEKIEAISQYKSQLFKMPNLISIISAGAICRGSQVNRQYAEAFEAIRLVI